MFKLHRVCRLNYFNFLSEYSCHAQKFIKIHSLIYDYQLFYKQQQLTLIFIKSLHKTKIVKKKQKHFY